MMMMMQQTIYYVRATHLNACFAYYSKFYRGYGSIQKETQKIRWRASNRAARMTGSVEPVCIYLTCIKMYFLNALKVVIPLSSCNLQNMIHQKPIKRAVQFEQRNQKLLQRLHNPRKKKIRIAFNLYSIFNPLNSS